MAATLALLAGTIPAAQVSVAATTATAVTAPALPFTIPAAAASWNPTSKKVFVNYFTPLPRTTDNEPLESNYYTRNFGNPQGECGKYVDGGGYLRDQPLPFYAPGSSTWRLDAARSEVEQAISAGIDGWYLDLLSFEGDPHPDRNVVDSTKAMIDAVVDVNKSRLGREFQIILQPDLAAGDRSSMAKRTPAELVGKLIALLKDPQTGAIPAARVKALFTSPTTHKAVLMPVRPEAAVGGGLSKAAYWAEVVRLLDADPASRAAALTWTLLPTFHARVFRSSTDDAPPADWESYAAFSYGISEWGFRYPAANAEPSTLKKEDLAKMRARGLTWVQPVSAQDARPKDKNYRESLAAENLRRTWALATTTQAGMVQVPTWNDYSENSHIAPSVRDGWGWLDLFTYYLVAYKTGSAPPITSDGVYLIHRTQLSTATSSRPVVVSAGLDGGPAVDVAEATVLLKDAGTVQLSSGGVKGTAKAGAANEAVVVTAPLKPGKVKLTITRGSAVSTFESKNLVTATPFVPDYHYVSWTNDEHPAFPTPYDTTPPSQPTQPLRSWTASSNTSTTGTTILTWAAPPATAFPGYSTSVPTHYVVTRTLDGTATVFSTIGTYWADSAVPVRATYTVAAQDAAGNVSAPVTFPAPDPTLIRDLTPPDAPPGRGGCPIRLAIAKEGGLAVRWAEPKDNQALRLYRVFRSTSASPDVTTDRVLLTTVPAPTIAAATYPLRFVDADPQLGLYYHVQAEDVAGAKNTMWVSTSGSQYTSSTPSE